MALARHRVEIELRRSGDIAVEARDKDEPAPGGMRERDLVAPEGARLTDFEGQNEADARAFVHAGPQDLGQAPGRFSERGRVKRSDDDGRGRA